MKSLIIIGPSGVGKGTIINELLRKYNQIFHLVLSFTTRDPRQGEFDGVHYKFVSLNQFQLNKKKGLMLENKQIFGNYYGSSREHYQKLCRKGYIPIMDVDVNGMQDIRSTLGISKTECLCILPPSYAILRSRLTNRKSETSSSLQKRMNENLMQIEHMFNIPHLYYVTNFQYQLTIYGIQLWLKNKFTKFKKQ